jgi:hydroxylamine reductase (hybrid-cluster protein)
MIYPNFSSVCQGAKGVPRGRFVQKALASTLDDSLSANDLVGLVMEAGKVGVTALALLDQANTETYGNPEITSVNIGVRNNPGILISGHDLKDLDELLKQTEGTGVVLALLSLGVKNIHLGPTLPAFLSPNVAKILIETFGIAGISTVEDDLASMIG